MMDPIDLRSDTVTLPTQEMLDAMRAAPLGDDVYGEDPTVNKLEQIAARMLGKEAAMLVVSGTMGNLVSLMAHASPGDEVLVDADAHIFCYEQGGMASIAGLMPMPLRSRGGILDPKEVAESIRPPNLHCPRPRVLCLENTHNRGGGRVVPPDIYRELCNLARERGLAVHLDGARIFNAAVAAGIPASDYAREADSVMFCLSKGLSCPVGSIVVGGAEFIDRARRCRKRLGGGMRQAGVIAAAGIVALESMLDRLAEDHEAARVLARGISDVRGLSVDLEAVQTNMVFADHSASALTGAEIVEALKTVGVLANAVPPHRIRLVTHRHISAGLAEEAARRIRSAVHGASPGR